MTGSNIGDTALQQLVDRTILDTDTTGTGRVSYQDFSVVCSKAFLLFLIYMHLSTVLNKP